MLYQEDFLDLLGQSVIKDHSQIIIQSLNTNIAKYLFKMARFKPIYPCTMSNLHAYYIIAGFEFICNNPTSELWRSLTLWAAEIDSCFWSWLYSCFTTISSSWSATVDICNCRICENTNFHFFNCIKFFKNCN